MKEASFRKWVGYRRLGSLEATDRQIAIIKRMYELADQGLPLGKLLERLIDSERVEEVVAHGD